MNLRPRHVATWCGAAAAALGLAACGSSPGSSAPTTTPPTAAPTASWTVATRTIAPVGAVLTASNGRTLYYLSTETSTSIRCTGGCTSTWTPYVVAKAASPTKAAAVHGTLSTTTRPNGATQVTFDGHPVYLYAGDSRPGQANGQGADGTWFVLKTTFVTPPPQSTTTTTGTNYGY